MATRWRWPPESWFGCRSANSFGRFTWARSSAIRAGLDARSRRPDGSPTARRSAPRRSGADAARCRGPGRSSAGAGAARRISECGQRQQIDAAVEHGAAVRLTSRRSVRASVDLPDPDSPTIARHSPAASVKLTPATATTCPKVLRNRARPNDLGACAGLEERSAVQDARPASSRSALQDAASAPPRARDRSRSCREWARGPARTARGPGWAASSARV